MNALWQQPEPGYSFGEIARMLVYRYGDGTVYLPQGNSRQLYHAGMLLGYISEDGFITRRGRELLALHSLDGLSSSFAKEPHEGRSDGSSPRTPMRVER
jgi:hypothetical protein